MSKKLSKEAEAIFKKQDKQVAMSEYDQRRKAELEKTARLRALRLAKEAADREAAAQAAAAKAVQAISVTDDSSVVKGRYYEHEVFESGRSLIPETG